MDPSQNIKRSKPIPPPLDLRGETSANSSISALKEFAVLATGPRSPLMQKSLPFRKRAHSVPDELHDGHASPPLDLTVLSPRTPVRTTPTICSTTVRPPSQPRSPATLLLSPPPMLLSPAPSSVGSSQEDIRLATIPRPSPTIRRTDFESAWRVPWPQPVWGCFQLGTLIRIIAAGRELIAQAEDIMNSPDWRGLWPDRFGPLIVQRMEYISSSPSCCITFTSTGQSGIPGEMTVIATCVQYHTFFVADKGWCAVNTDVAKQRYGMPFQQLECGDLCQMPLRFAPVSSPDICDRFKRFSFPPEDKGPSHSPLLSPLSPFVLSPPNTPTQKHQPLQTALQPCLTQPSLPMPPTQPQPQPQPQPAVPQPPPQTQFQPVPQTQFQPVPQSQFQPLPNQQPQPQSLSQSLLKEPKQPRSQSTLDPDRPKRPMNAFMLFAKQHRLKLIQMHPGKDNRFVSVILGEAWRQLPAEKKEVFIAEARALSHERKRLYPECWKRKRTHSAS